ncbi:polysaccharide pyruvyl transferase family protein [Afipia felis]|uniref:Polysaccharide pyruvyl transferase n=2 Tax=Afipia felis TaxID=1035 RepID=A0A380W824_AFIFE|nr:polysaccharide pyruvyl transferase family protein [Afipia felis]EKS28240.1 hypothetical protein HMPREF9697_00768 [Afipia felis ATCC 53690]SUU76950.1 Polysaccharide pyruvyl transferase [Afipia felis]SUU85016.1 Polysaccharide pyruvyl transferase [Afipia felis]
MFNRVQFWLKGQDTQNFGDALARIFFDKIFLPIGAHGGAVFLVGSVVDDMWIEPSLAAYAGAKPSFWGCGIRSLEGLKPSNREQIEIFAVRGPISARKLGVERQVPMGDSALILPAIYRPKKRLDFKGESICIPHFNDTRPDSDLLSVSGCDRIVRPNIGTDPANVYDLIDIIASADFVLSSSLHGAIVAAAYQRPFAFWDSGEAIDVPLKWEDFAASVGCSARFAKTKEEGRKIFDRTIMPYYEPPRVTALLERAPFVVRPEAYINAYMYEGSDIPVALADYGRHLSALSTVAADQSNHSQEIIVQAAEVHYPEDSHEASPVDDLCSGG